jgi:peptidoglycan-associated lipoprotein
MGLLASSCSITGKLNKADRLFEEGGYSKAADIYKKVVRSKKVPPARVEPAYFNYAESYRRIAKTKEAEAAFVAFFNRRKTANDPEMYLRYGQVLLSNEKYDKAQEQFERYRSERPDDPQAAVGLASLEWVKSYPKDSLTYAVEPVTAFNMGSHDFAPAFGADDYETLLFTSSRKADNVSKKTYDVTGTLSTDIYFSRLSRAGKWDRPRNMGKEINSKFDDGAAAFNSSYSTLYFTRCPKIKREKAGCKIYTAQRMADEWSEPADLKLVPDSITAAHPSLSADDLTLYFASDLADGMGKMDLWKVTRNGENDEWGDPIHMGAQINTQGNEMYPFAHANGCLYFSSDGRPGFGGLDIYRACPDSATNGWTIENVGAPMNSPADDFAVIFERDNDRGYLASRRKDKGTRGGDDIFRFARDTKPVEYFFEGLVRDERSGKVLENTDVRLIGSNGAILRKRTEADGMFRFRVNAGLEYLALAAHTGFLNGKLRFSSKEWENGYTHRDTFALVSTDRPIEIPNIFFDFGKATLSDASRHSLDSLVTIMKDNPTIIIELRAHTDNRGSDVSNTDLSQRRAQAVVDYLIQNGIDEARMEAVGLGESEPKTTTAEMAAQHAFLSAGQRLDEKFINTLKSEAQQEICHAFNRRTEMQVIRSDYVTE